MSPASHRKRGDRGTDECGSAKETDLELAMTEREQISRQENRHEAVSERAQRPRGEYETRAASRHSPYAQQP